MQTFLPYPDFAQSAAVLDSKRLGNQCYRECLTLYKGGWSSHPAARMWLGFDYAFCHYAWCCANEMGLRGGWKPGVADKWREFWKRERENYEPLVPPWIGDEMLHHSHKANLIRKDPGLYTSIFGCRIEPMDGYFWPRLYEDGTYELYFKESN